MQELTRQLQRGDSKASLTRAEITFAVEQLADGIGPEAVRADFLRALRTKGETADEIAGFTEALLARAVDPGLRGLALPGPMLDVCGTGGDRLDLFNVSTTSMFVLAAGGVVVVKHGNRAITSKCGGADVLEHLGISIDLSPSRLRGCIEEVGAGFIFAPSYHPAFKTIRPIRAALAAEGVPTIFNLLGPLLNPARPPYQLVGVFARSLLPTYGEVLRTLGRKRAWAVHGDGMDELATTGPTDVQEATQEGLREFTVDPAELGLATTTAAALRGGDCAANAAILTGILDGTVRGAPKEIVALNAAAGFVITGLCADLGAGLQRAREQIEDGRALGVLRALQAWSRENEAAASG